MTIFVGCDLGGTNIKAGLVDIDLGRVLVSQSIPTYSRQGPEAVLKRIADLIENLIRRMDIDKKLIKGLGVSAPGMLDLETNTALFLPNMIGGWRNVPIGERLKGYLGLEVSILNDVQAITFGEWVYGAGKGFSSMVCVAVGTGVGGGLIVNNTLVLGLGGSAGELGHQTVEIDGPICGCGNHGCVEVYSSGPAIAASAARGVRQGWSTKIVDLINHDLNQLTPEIVANAAEMGDGFALEVWKTAGKYLGIGIANVLTTLAVERVVIGGGVAKAGDLLLNPIRETIKQRVFMMPVERVEVVKAELGTNAGILGMAAWRAQASGYKLILSP
jgi:glucokinase